MGSRKHNRAEMIKEARKSSSFAQLNNVPTSPRKMRLVADMVRGMKVETALHVLKQSPKEASGRLHKLLLSAVDNWRAKNEGTRLEDADLFVSRIQVDGGRILKRIRPADKGRAHRIRKRSNHVTIIVDNRLNKVNQEQAAEQTK